MSAVWTKDPLIAASLYQQMGNPPEQLDQIENGLLHLADSGNLDELQEVLNTLPPLSFGNYYSESRLAQRWFQADPDSMRDYALTLPLGLNRRKFLEAYATGSAELDIEQSWELGEQATDPFLKKQLFESSLIALTKEDPAQAIELANSLDSETGSETLSEVLNAWIRQSPQVALKYIQSMPTSSAKSKAIAEYVSNSRNDLTFAQSQAIIATLPQGKEQAYATGRVAAEWAQSNPEALADWVNQMPAGDARDGAVYALVEALSKYDYAQAFAWESTLEDDSSRQWRLRSTLRNFAEIDPQGAKDLLESSDIPSTEKATLRDELFNK